LDFDEGKLDPQNHAQLKFQKAIHLACSEDDLAELLTLWEPRYDIFVLWNRPKTSSCQLPYQCHSSSADCARELFKGSNRSASLLVCTRKNFFVEGCRFFVSDVMTSVK